MYFATAIGTRITNPKGESIQEVRMHRPIMEANELIPEKSSTPEEDRDSDTPSQVKIPG